MDDRGFGLTMRVSVLKQRFLALIVTASVLFAVPACTQSTKTASTDTMTTAPVDPPGPFSFDVGDATIDQKQLDACVKGSDDKSIPVAVWYEDCDASSRGLRALRPPQPNRDGVLTTSAILELYAASALAEMSPSSDTSSRAQEQRTKARAMVNDARARIVQLENTGATSDIRTSATRYRKCLFDRDPVCLKAWAKALP